VRQKKTFVFILLCFVSGCFMTPLIWTVCSALKTNREIAHNPNRFLPLHPTLANFPGAFAALPFTTFVANTVFVTLVATIATVASASLVAYGFARFQFTGKNTLFYVMLSTMMLPSQVTMIPVFLIWRALHGIDTFAPLTIPSFFGGGAFNIFLLRQFFLGIPRELDEAMHIDGAGYFSIWRQLILPLSKPALMTVVLFSFLGNWDNFDGPLIYLNSSQNYTVSIGLRMFQDNFGSDQGQLMAASLIHIVPTIILFLIAQKFFLRGIAISGMGGR
jgi:multiple sugar transport system permease protein